MNTITFPSETRGRPRTYDFEGMKVNEVRRFARTNTANVLYCAAKWSENISPRPKYQARKENNFVYLKRIE